MMPNMIFATGKGIKMIKGKGDFNYVLSMKKYNPRKN
jgi:hypothetical protein